VETMYVRRISAESFPRCAESHSEASSGLKQSACRQVDPATGHEGWTLDVGRQPRGQWLSCRRWLVCFCRLGGRAEARPFTSAWPVRS
jgi:hypothetical protein